MKRPAPPYLKQSLAHLHRDGLFISVGSWDFAQSRVAEGRPAALLPLGRNVEDFDWSQAARFVPPVIVDMDKPSPLDMPLLKRLAKALIRAGCRRVITPKTDGTQQRWLHPKEAERLNEIERNTFWAEP